MADSSRNSIITGFLKNLAKTTVSSAGKATGAVVGTAIAGPAGTVAGFAIGATFDALAKAVIDEYVAQFKGSDDQKQRLLRISTEQNASDMDGLRQMILDAAGIANNDSNLEQLAAALESGKPQDEPLLRQAVDRLFTSTGIVTTEPEELGRAINLNKQIAKHVHATGGSVAIGNISVQGVENVVLNINGNGQSEAAEERPDPPAFQCSTSKLPQVSQHFFGREDRINDLDEAWANGQLNVLTLVAQGGEGKTSLVSHWLTRFAQDGFRGARRVFGWSFYSQGIGDGSASAEPFINEALRWFGDEKPDEGSAWSKGARLAELIRKERTLLILDGLEPMQHPEEALDGGLREQSLQALIKELAAHNPGLLIITTRLKVRELNQYEGSTAHRIDLKELPPDACVQLLRELGVSERSSDKELREAAKHFKYHALSINLLGTYVAERYDDKDIRHWKEVSLQEADAWNSDHQNHAWQVMKAYEKWFAEGNHKVELAILRMIGLFNRPASKAEIDALRQAPAIPGMTEPLIGLSESNWLLALKQLRDAKLLLPEDERAKGVLGAHPLIREYSDAKLKATNITGYRKGHERLYEFLISDAGCPKKFPDTLEEMQPLYAAIGHGCKAGRHSDVLENVFRDRIRRRNEAYSIKILGAFGSDLAATSHFFEGFWSNLANVFDAKDQAWLLGEYSFSLRALGRLGEADEPLRLGLNLVDVLIQEDGSNAPHWLKQAAIKVCNLSELLMTLGRVEEAIDAARRCVEYADRSSNAFHRVIKRASLADALHQAGETTEAVILFHDSEALQKQREHRFPLLYSQAGYQYCGLLLADAAGAATRTSKVKKAVQVHKRATTTLSWVERVSLILDIALDHLTVGRSLLMLAELGEAKLSDALAELDTAVDGLRKAAQIYELPRGLLARAACYRVAVEAGDESSIKDAVRDLLETIDISLRDEANGGVMKLFLCDAHLEYARLRLAQHEHHDASQRLIDEARDHVTNAEALINECGYHRRDAELADLKRRLGDNTGPSLS